MVCIDEAHVLRNHLGDYIITEMPGQHIQQNHEVNEDAKRGTQSVMLWAIRSGAFAKKVLCAGTSSQLRNVENFGTWETKPVSPIQLVNFEAWTPDMAVEYVTSLVNIDPSCLSKILLDNYRPRITLFTTCFLWVLTTKIPCRPLQKEYKISSKTKALKASSTNLMARLFTGLLG